MLQSCSEALGWLLDLNGLQIIRPGHNLFLGKKILKKNFKTDIKYLTIRVKYDPTVVVPIRLDSVSPRANITNMVHRNYHQVFTIINNTLSCKFIRFFKQNFSYNILIRIPKYCNSQKNHFIKQINDKYNYITNYLLFYFPVFVFHYLLLIINKFISYRR